MVKTLPNTMVWNMELCAFSPFLHSSKTWVETSVDFVNENYDEICS